MRKKENESQINYYIRLGSVLQRERSPLKQEAVDAVLRSRASLRDKIEQINHIDQSDERYAKTRYRKKQAASEPAPDAFLGEGDDEEQNELRRVKRNQYKLKRTHVESRFFSFLFGEYGRIKKFGAATGMLVFKAFFRIRLDRRALASIADEYDMKSVRPVLPVLEHVIQNGWRMLEKFEYNCVALVLEFCRALMHADFRGLPLRDRMLINRFKELERLFLVLHRDREIKETVFLALSKIGDGEPQRFEEVKACSLRLQALLANPDNRPALGSLLLALNMLCWRRFFVFADLVDRTAGRLISDTVFDCPENVRSAIASCIEDQESQLGRLIRERVRLVRELSFLPLTGKGEVDDAALVRFYNLQPDAEKAGFFNRDSEQILFLLVKLVDYYIGCFRPLLCGALDFEPSASGVVFEDAAFGSDFDRLAHVHKKLERHTFSFGSIARQRYLEIRRQNKTATLVEADAISIVTEILSCLHDIARKLTSRLSAQEGTAAGVPEAAAVDASESVGAGPVSFFDRLIKTGGILSGKKVHEALRFAANIAYGIGLFMADPALRAMIGREAPLKAEIEGILRLLERIAPARVFEEIRRKYVVM